MSVLRLFLSEYSVPLERVSETQLTLCDPERELLPLVLANRNYTLQKGGETDSSHDLPGIQTQLARRFLAGKPLIQTVKVQPVNTAACRCHVAVNMMLTCISSNTGHIKVPEPTPAGFLCGSNRSQRKDPSGKISSLLSDLQCFTLIWN